ncbi:hypothetical protein AMAG_14629 [Allomyces macrogynus ATCC 38327]|uniref:Long-chain-fatty-acid--CoA ligase n=1 Tax=Allomyces macrogynus (strain ATCC 38327) TaxID=578462 RepID=A0A0L0T6Z6_ALLM3|nr:hypothetical protein AMAG_14629 [Allomyces macrogynus ATCC 38327]|eukprot:KNE70505.1 hypothetical protein AMAG_14629 [Allomyces macrogynus ATCC 38327]
MTDTHAPAYNAVKRINLKKQAVQVPGSATPGSTPAYRLASTSASLVPCNPVTKARTLYANFQYAATHYPNDPCFGHRALVQESPAKAWAPYTWQTYGQVADRMTNLGSGLLRVYDEYVVQPARAKGEPVARLDKWHVGLYSINRPEWLLAEGACNCYSLVSVPLYDTLGPDALEYIVNHAEVQVVVASADRLINLVQVRDKCPGLKVIVSMDPLDSAAAGYLKLWAAEKDLVIISINEVEDLGRTAPLKHHPPTPEDLCTICYTSGTTGNPKGAMLTHGNMAATNMLGYHGLVYGRDDTHLSYLPLSHIFERAVVAMAMAGGSKIAFYRGDVTLLVEDIVASQPTAFISVPRLLNRIHAKLRAGTVDAPGVKGALFRRAYAAKIAQLESGGGYEHGFWDRLLFSKVKQVLGGKLRFVVSGSAPLHRDVMQFLRVALCCEVLEGFGQTENAAVCSVQLMGEHVPAQVGVPIASCEVKLVDVAEMGYFAKENRGEICIRGYNVFKGYWKDVEKTKETIDEDGWLHTGDIGTIDARGCIAIIDRKKALLKLSQGEYVAPEKIENTYALCPLVLQMFVHGDSLQSELVAMMVPEPEAFLAFVKAELGFSTATAADISKLCKDPKVVAAVLHELTVVGKEQKLRGFEFVKALHLDPAPWSVESGILTPSFKLKRPQAAQKYRATIDAMYAQLAADQKVGKNEARAPVESMDKAKL